MEKCGAVVLSRGCGPHHGLQGDLRPFLASFALYKLYQYPDGLHCVVHCVVFATASFKLCMITWRFCTGPKNDCAPIEKQLTVN
jgi:hypothetical protein